MGVWECTEQARLPVEERMAQNVLEVTDSTFEAEVVQSTLPVG